ncbi:NADH-quinone oxidoreductase subunit I [candidate division LCP-89 bacterium B3_LCP]|uniref:NADH-quinone oxidoreductase subunit I n=1 Tax=candidate division LCP-89 bacterium B3_LCP TaxID=2012998 RepID=A0A532V623_UNCL8|nr:MAG: NADH-quinone oxidoreductase subunit I [candidate division LCP-89 bacterium B3_LCP]
MANIDYNNLKTNYETSVQKVEMGLWEKIYYPEVIRGLLLTTGHFVRNMTVHIAHVFGLARNKRGAVTYQYPEERRPIHRRYRGRHRLMKKPDGSERCTACMLCETICPTQCISIIPQEHPDPAVEKHPASYEIDILRCCFCGYCVEACPCDAIRMDTQKVEIANWDRTRMVYDKEYLMTDITGPGAPPENDPPLWWLQ